MGCPECVDWEPPETEVKTDYDAVGKFLEDLGKREDICSVRVPHQEYKMFKRFVCHGDVDILEDAPWNDAIAFATYYLIFHRRDLETARQAIELLESRMLDDEEEAMLKILKAAYKAASNPPCSDPEQLAQYVAKVKEVPKLSGRVALLKALVLMHLTGKIDAEEFKDKIRRVFEENKTVVLKCNNASCTKEETYRPMPFHYFAYYIVDRVKPLCPRDATFEECLDEKRSRRKVVKTALVPVVVAVLALLFHQLLIPFAAVTAFYVLWTIRQIAKNNVPVCIGRVWNQNGWLLEKSFFAPLGIYIYTGLSAAAANPPNLPLLFPSILGLLTALGGFVIYTVLEPYSPRNVDFPKTQNSLLEDLANAWHVWYICEGSSPQLRRIICMGDTEAAKEVSENYVLAFVAYYLMFHINNIETADKVLDVLRSRNLDSRDKAALEVLETARGVAKNPPCNDPKALRQYVERINGVRTHGWASVLKALVLAHLINDEDYKEDVKRAILWAAEKHDCDNPNVCHFAYRMLGRAKPLCP